MKRLRASFPGLPLVVGRFTSGEPCAADGEALREAGADQVAYSLLESMQVVYEVGHLVPRAERAEAAGAAADREEVAGEARR